MIKTQKCSVNSFFEDAKSNINITDDRKNLLLTIAKTIADEYILKKKVHINFICTHNSRRSQMGQVWTFFATEYFKIKNIFSFSGGTKITSFHRNTVKSLQNTGFKFSIVDFSHQNPRYLITFEGTNKSILGFSKLYYNKENKSPYIAITTCDNADNNCPFISEATYRFHLPYTDPKISDNTDFKTATYLKTTQQIAGEVFILFKEVKRLLSLYGV